LDDKIPTCERAFAEQGLPIVFRIPSITEDTAVDGALATRGYTKFEKTSVRLLDLAGFDGDGAGVAVAPTASDAWRAALARFNGLTDTQQRSHRAILDAIAAPTCFAAWLDGAAIGSIGFAVLQDGFVCLNSIATDPAKRRRGWSRATTCALLAWAKRHGATHAYLPVVKTNLPALALYNSLGFRTELYRYHYRARRD
jgi:ribosomal protein S18 acetylase RimI-like enzyme